MCLFQPVTARTWLVFEAHFMTAQEQLRCICGPAMRNATFTNGANYIINSWRS